MFQSPNYPSFYKNDLNVCWLVEGENYVRLSFPFFFTERDHDFVRIYDGESTDSPLLLETSGGFTGFYNHSVVASKNQMLVVFTSDSNTYFSGFFSSYSSCTVLSSASGIISSPNYPRHYNYLDSVCWVINPPVGYVVTLSFNNINTEEGYDVVRVFDGNSTNSPLLSSASGNVAPSAVTSSSNSMLVVFSSDGSDVLPGFEAYFYSVFADKITYPVTRRPTRDINSLFTSLAPANPSNKIPTNSPSKAH